MDKRTILAIVLSMLVMLTWSYVARQNASHLQPIENKTVTSMNPSLPVALQDPLGNLATEEVLLDGKRIFFLPQRAGIKQIKFSQYANHILEVNGLYLDGLSADFAQTTSPISFVLRDAEKTITQKYTYSKSNNCIELSITVQNNQNADLNLSLPLVLTRIGRPTGQEARFQSQEIIIKTKDKFWRAAPWKEYFSREPVEYIAYRDRYFCLVLQPQDHLRAAFNKKINSNASLAGLVLDIQVPANKQFTANFLLFAGAQEESVLGRINPEWRAIVNYGFFDAISKFLLKILRFLFKIVQNWGLAIILLSLLIYFVLFPLSLKQIHAMKEMQAIQPKVEELRKIYKDNPQKMNKEIMELYREHKVNPFGGCLPLLFQIPVFFSLYQALMRSWEIKGARFLWIKDLSQPDQLFTLPTQLPVIGNSLNILPLLMCLIMFLQQKMTAKSAVSSEQQKMMLVLFPILFGVIFYHMPAGLVLYWLVNSLLMFVYQLKLSKTDGQKQK
ncbi:MAG: membrane protein insertase YidC [Candidatus Omnitrophica bacterium]|nr:membrane protein insertase YidC [Candidatus Omnitrophota bacterium]